MDPFDLPTLFALRETIEGCDPAGPATLRMIGRTPRAHHVALLPGSFDPPTAAHVLLVERARREGFGAVVMILARHTAGKKRGGLILEDRLLALRSICDPSGAVAISSHGLYVDQAEAAAGCFPDAELTFLVGSDKVLQIFDPAWYGDREDALARLFARASLLVAPRADHADALTAILDAPRNRRWRDRVEILRLHPAVIDLSSTRVRGLLRAGADPAGLVPPPVAELLAAVHAFAPPVAVGSEEVDLYQLREAAIDAIWRARASDADLRALLRAASVQDNRGKAMRDELARGTFDVRALSDVG